MNEFDLKGSLSYKDFVIHILNNLLGQYDIILDELENCFTSSDVEALAIEVIWKKMNLRHEKITNKKEGKKRKKKPWKPTVDNVKEDAISVVNTVTSQLTQNVQKIKRQ